MPRACDKLDAETFEVVVGVAQRVDFQLATVAGAGVDVAYGERPAECAQDFFLQPRNDNHLLGGSGRRLGLDTGAGDLAKNVQHV